MQRRIPFFILTAVGLFMITELFLPQPAVRSLKLRVVDLAAVLLATGTVLMVGAVAVRELVRLRQQPAEWPYAAALLVGLLSMLGLGVLGGSGDAGFTWLVMHAYAPLQTAFFALTAFYLVTAGMRSAHTGGWQLWLMLTVAGAVVIGRMPLVASLLPGWAAFADWLVGVPNAAAKRAVLIGASVGAIGMGLRVILGLEPRILGRE